jgi:hypothetical protein
MRTLRQRALLEESPVFTYSLLMGLCGGRLGIWNTACPLRGPDRRLPQNPVRQVFRIWLNRYGYRRRYLKLADLEAWERGRVSGKSVEAA